jgi:hypothetical protein
MWCSSTTNAAIARPAWSVSMVRLLSGSIERV